MSAALDLNALEALARYCPDAPVKFEARAADVVRALQALKGGPANLSTRQCAAEFGWKDGDWRRWAPDLDGATRVGKRWRIPRATAQAKADELMKRTEKRTRGDASNHGQRRGGNYGRFKSRKEAEGPSALRSGAAVIPIGGRMLDR